MQPIYLLISLFGACTYLLYLQGRRGMLRQIGYVLPILLLMAIMNPVFNHEGTTILWYFPNDNPLTLGGDAYSLPLHHDGCIDRLVQLLQYGIYLQ